MHYVCHILDIVASGNKREPMKNLEGIARKLLEEAEPGMSIRFHYEDNKVVNGRIKCITATGMILGRKGKEVYTYYPKVKSYDLL